MIYKNAEAGTAPATVTLEPLPDGGRLVRLADNIREEERSEGESSWKSYLFDECVFKLPEGHEGETAESIEGSFSDWWSYGSEDEEGETITLEDRISILEDLILGEV